MGRAADRTRGFLYLGPVVSRRQMDVLHCGYLDRWFSRLAATLPGRRASAADAISRERGRRACDVARWQIVHSHLRHATVRNLAARRQDRREADHLCGILVFAGSVTGWQEALLLA